MLGFSASYSDLHNEHSDFAALAIFPEGLTKPINILRMCLSNCPYSRCENMDPHSRKVSTKSLSEALPKTATDFRILLGDGSGQTVVRKK